MIFFIQNIRDQHWVLLVAVNPGIMMSRISLAALEPPLNEAVYGYIYIDPMETTNRNGTIPKGRRTVLDDPTRNKELIFLLNCLARFRDMELQGDSMSEPEHTFENVWCMGAVGPFGRVCLPTQLDLWEKFRQLHPRFYYPQLKTIDMAFPAQVDGHNCGILVFVSMIDLILTQWNIVWHMKDVIAEPTSNIVGGWDKIISDPKTGIRLPLSYNIGTAFLEDPKTAPGTTYSRLCGYFRTEMAVLMERMHCIYVDAFSQNDGRTRSSILGVQRKEYLDALRDDDLIPYLKAQLARNDIWIDMRQQHECNERQISLNLYLTEGFPIFDKKCLGQVNEEIILQLGKNDFIKGLRNDNAEQHQETEIQTLCTGIIANFIQGSKTAVAGLVTPKKDQIGSCEDPHNLLTPDVGGTYVQKQIPTTQDEKPPSTIIGAQKQHDTDMLNSEGLTNIDTSKSCLEESDDAKESAVATLKPMDSPQPESPLNVGKKEDNKPKALDSPAATHREPSPPSSNTETTQDIVYLDIDPIVEESDYLAEEDDGWKEHNHDRFARLFKAGYKFVDVLGKGNCGYYACLLGLYHTQSKPLHVTSKKKDMLLLRQQIKVFLSSNKDILWDNCGGTHPEYNPANDLTNPHNPKSKLAFALQIRDDFDDAVKNTRIANQSASVFYNGISDELSQHFHMHVHGCAIAILYQCRIIIHISYWNQYKDTYDWSYTIIDAIDAPENEFCTITSQDLPEEDSVYVAKDTKKKRTFHLFLMLQSDGEDAHYMFMYRPDMVMHETPGMPEIQLAPPSAANTNLEEKDDIKPTALATPVAPMIIEEKDAFKPSANTQGSDSSTSDDDVFTSESNNFLTDTTTAKAIIQPTETEIPPPSTIT